MWCLIPSIIALLAYTIYRFAKAKTAQDFLVSSFLLILVALSTTGTIYTSIQIDKAKDDITQCHLNYRQEIQNTKYNTIQETMNAYYDQRISETCTVVDGVTTDVQYSIKPKLTEFVTNKE